MPFTDTVDGRVVCTFCKREYGHTPICPIVAIDEHVRDMAAHMGLFVASMRESMDAIARLLRDDRES